MNQRRSEETSSQIKALTEELKWARLKIEGLETMIEVAEEKFKIKIRERTVTRQPGDCDKDCGN